MNLSKDKHTCPICLQPNKTARELYIHLGLCHYGSVTTLNIPEEVNNQNEHRFRCDVCTGGFHSLRELYRHQRSHFDQVNCEPKPKKRRMESSSHITHRNKLGQGSSTDKHRKSAKNLSTNHQNDPKPGTSGIQLRIDKGTLRRPNESEQAMDTAQQQEVDKPAPSGYQLREKSRRHNRKFNAEDIVYVLRVNEHVIAKKIAEVLNELYNMFQNLLNDLRNDLQNGDLVRFYMNHPMLYAPIIIPAQPIEEISIEDIMTEIEKVLQSEEELHLDEHFEIHVGILRIPRGGRGEKVINVQQAVKRKRSIVEITNNVDSLCFDRAVVVCLARLNNNQKQWKNIIRKDTNHQLKEAVKLRESVGLPKDQMVSLKDISLYENLLGVQIIVVSNEAINSIIYSGRQKCPKQIYLLKLPNHYHSIISIQGFYGTNHFCNTCLKAYNNHNHSCSTTCTVCKNSNCTNLTQIFCKDCNMTCRSDECFKRHKATNVHRKFKEASRQSLCDKFCLCLQCHMVLKRDKRSPEKHICGEYFCQNCKEYVIGRHLCYQRYCEPKSQDVNFVFFDFECRQDAIAQCSLGYLKPSRCSITCKDEKLCKKCSLCMNCRESWCGKYKHLPNFAVAQTVCDKCVENPLTRNSKCVKCGSRCDKCNVLGKKQKYLSDPCPDTCGLQERIFYGDNTGDSFSEWLFHSKRSGFTAVAHNMGGYDGYFLLDYLLRNWKKPDNIIYQGSYITFMEINQGLNIKVIDSYKFLPMKLSKLSKAFGIPENKGWFPHFFNLKQNWNYLGPYPEVTSMVKSL